jgi:alkylated DNA repair protein (DNA oxidative demethylase)
MLAGFRHLPGFLSLEAQRKMLGEIAAVIAAAPLYRATMPRTGRPLSVEMTNAGPLGWYSDRGGYRYEARHPLTGTPWPPIPPTVLAVWGAVAGYPRPPEACLVNVYRGPARMGLHQDRDEAAMDAPVVSISLGEAALFRIGMSRQGPTESLTLESGDVVVLAGPARLAFHGIDHLLREGPALLTEASLGHGRINLTLRRVTKPVQERGAEMDRIRATTPKFLTGDSTDLIRKDRDRR